MEAAGCYSCHCQQLPAIHLHTERKENEVFLEFLTKYLIYHITVLFKRLCSVLS